MTELKTLKDFDVSWGRVEKYELKAEAIKWVKEMLMDIEKTEKGIPNDLDILKKKYAIPQQIHAIACMKHFFNITEEDLR